MIERKIFVNLYCILRNMNNTDMTCGSFYSLSHVLLTSWTVVQTDALFLRTLGDDMGRRRKQILCKKERKRRPWSLLFNYTWLQFCCPEIQSINTASTAIQLPTNTTPILQQPSAVSHPLVWQQWRPQQEEHVSSVPPRQTNPSHLNDYTSCFPALWCVI